MTPTPKGLEAVGTREGDARAAGRPADPAEIERANSRLWLKLCARYLPLCPEGSLWRYSRDAEPGDPEQGWKLHISATVPDAAEVLRRVAPFILARGAKFKASCSLDELGRLNSGVFYGYSQVGKFITVYPRSDAEAASLARGLHRLTRGLHAPAIPFDIRYRSGSSVFYRYGSFSLLETQAADGARVPALRAPSGELIPDARDLEARAPEWAADPFIKSAPPLKTDGDSPLKTYRAFRALAQRGKGGVYQAVDLSTSPPRLCVLKEGRKYGELGWDGRDGRWRVRHERGVLESLRAAGVEVPRVYASFEVEGNYYLATEFVAGENLQQVLNRMRRRLSVRRALELGARIAQLLSGIHRAGWAWRDCKPSNIVVTKKGGLTAIDFEGACPAAHYDPSRWSTPIYAPPEWQAAWCGRSNVPEDLYALGSVLFFMLTGELKTPSRGDAFRRLRRGVPAEASGLISALLDADPDRRPSARAAEQQLRAALSALKPAGRT